MKASKKNLLHILGLLYLGMVMGCSSVSSITVTMSADTGVNPDINNRPSPSSPASMN